MSTTRTQHNFHFYPADIDIPDEPAITVVGPLVGGELVLSIDLDGQQIQLFFANRDPGNYALGNETLEQVEIIAGQLANAANALMGTARGLLATRINNRAIDDDALDRIRS